MENGANTSREAAISKKKTYCRAATPVNYIHLSGLLIKGEHPSLQLDQTEITLVVEVRSNRV